jgi:capsular exopolysaccharide synthesis family protein
MKNDEFKRLLPGRPAFGHAGPGPESALATATPSLLAVLWGRRWTFAFTVLFCVVGAGVYLIFATRVYRATSTLFVQQNAPRALGDGAAAPPQSETFLQTQADVIQSAPVLARALNEVSYRNLRTFEGVAGDPVVWLRRGNRLRVEVVKRSDVISVAVESPYPREAADLADAVVNAYIVEQAQTSRDLARNMVQVLQREKEQLQRRRDANVRAMLLAQRGEGAPTFREGKGNLVLGRLDALAASLSAAELATMDLRSQQEGVLAAIDSPQGIRTFVEGLQFKGKDLGDREYDELRNQLVQYEASLASASGVLGANNVRVRSLQNTVATLRAKLSDKEKSIAEGQYAEVTAKLAAAEQKESDLRAALDAQRLKALDMSPAAAEYAKLEADVTETQKRVDALDSRIAELSVNSIESTPSNVRVLQPALVSEKAVKPDKALTLAAALLVGWVLGIGLATLREWRDAPLRTPGDVSAQLGLPLIGVIPRINRRLSPVERGHVLRLDPRSPVAEAYRSVRTSLDLGDARTAKTVLLASPARDDGKSTTAANLAVAFAQAGDRTLLLDCDLREPVQHLIFDAEVQVGVSTVMPGESKLRDSILTTRVPNLYLLPCGPVPRNPSELLASDRFKYLLRTLADAFDRVVIDSPSLSEVTDGRILAAAADVTLVVLRMNQSMRRSGALALDGLNEVGAYVLGAVANDAASTAGYRIEGGPWQYAPGRSFDAPAPAAAAASHRLQNGELHHATSPAGHLSMAGVPVKEPDWPAVTMAAEPDWPAEQP